MSILIEHTAEKYIPVSRQSSLVFLYLHPVLFRVTRRLTPAQNHVRWPLTQPSASIRY